MVAKRVLLFKVKLRCRRDPSCQPCYSSDRRRILVRNNLKSHFLSVLLCAFLIFSLFLLPGLRGGRGATDHTVLSPVTDGQEKTHHCCCDQWSTGPSEEPSVLTLSPVSQLGTVPRLPGSLPLLLWGDRGFTVYFSAPLPFLHLPAHLFPLTQKLFQLVQCLSSEDVAADALTFSYSDFCAGSSSYVFGNADIRPWNVILPLLFLVASLYVLLIRLIQVVRLMFDTSINLCFWQKCSTFSFLSQSCLSFSLLIKT